MRKLQDKPFYISQYSCFEVIDTPIDILFYDLIYKLKKLGGYCKISNKNYKIKSVLTEFIYSCYVILEIFNDSNGMLVVELTRRSGSRELFYKTFHCIKNIYIEKKQKFLSLITKPSFDMFVKSLENKLFEPLLENTTIEYIISLNILQLEEFKSIVTNMLQGKDIDLLRMGCILLQHFILQIGKFFQKDISHWISILCMQYQILPFDSIFTNDILDKIIMICRFQDGK